MMVTNNMLSVVNLRRDTLEFTRDAFLDVRLKS